MKETRDSFLVFGAPLIGEREIGEVTDCLRSGWLGTGPKVARFEEEFCAYKHARHAVALSSCTAALHLSLIACDLEPGAEVITSALTFCATVNAIIHAGAVPVLADVNPDTMNLSPESILEKISPRTRAIVAVHFGGRACEMDRILEIATAYRLRVIEDCAHAIETEYRGTKAGNFGDFGCFSFYVTKNVVTGEGGMVLTAREEDAARIKTLALHGLTRDAWKRFSDAGYRHYDVVECGFKYNMMDLQAAIGLHQLSNVERNWRRRREIWRMYNSRLTGLPVNLPVKTAKYEKHAYHLYPVLIDEAEAGLSRDDFLAAMTERKIGVGVHYRSIPEHSYYQKTYGWVPDEYPNAARVGRQTVSLPLSAKLRDADVQDVIHAVRGVFRRARRHRQAKLPSRSAGHA